jgi:hypothetical protein
VYLEQAQFAPTEVYLEQGAIRPYRRL